MEIAAATVDLTASHSLTSERETSESLRVWEGTRQPRTDAQPAENRNTPPVADSTSFSAQALAASRTRESATAPPEETPSLDPRLEAIRRTLEILTGRKIRVTSFSPQDSGAAPPSPPTGETPQQGAGWGLAYDAHTSFREEETTTVSAAGRIQTGDGRTIDFTLDLAMARAYVESTDISIRAGDALLTDPLVVNFDGTAAQLTDAAFAFDLDNDGTAEEVAQLAAGSGFLALDRNQDGVINNGSELFGPASGHGFAELADYDSDQNGWLDANDPIFSSLRLWSKDAEGNDTLASLADRNIGALYLKPVESEFRLTDAANVTLGRIRQSSLFVREDGTAGTVQEVDLAV